MNEIPKNNPAIPQQIQKVESVKTESIQDMSEQAAETVQKEIKEIVENPADRATIKHDNLENDIKIFVANPKLAERALEVAKLAEKRYAEAGIENPEMKALAVSRAFVTEFQK